MQESNKNSYCFILHLNYLFHNFMWRIKKPDIDYFGFKFLSDIVNNSNQINNNICV